MEYEYIAITMAEGGSFKINDTAVEELNRWFGAGWEFVKDIKQTPAVSTGSATSTEKWSPIIVILRKSKSLRV